jgi:cytochrome oxidase Cu insertion factor (SCO1/SenC/PrrC family)
MSGVLRGLATLAIVALLALAIFIPDTPVGRRGSEAVARADVPGAVGAPGETLPELSLRDLDGRPLALADFRGHPLLVTFERSVDW